MTDSHRHQLIPTVLGQLMVVAHRDAISGLYFPGHWYPPSAALRGTPVSADPLIDEAGRQLTEYLDGGRRVFELPLATAGNELYEQVWQLLREIPYGSTTTYGALAVQLGHRSLAQTVGQAVGHNPISIVIPCHRVVGADGSLTGFAGGLERKQFLLGLEEPAAVAAARLF